MEWKCPKCESENSDIRIICDCGYNFKTGMISSESKEKEKKEEKKKKINEGAMLGSIIAFLGHGSALFFPHLIPHIIAFVGWIIVCISLTVARVTKR